VLATPSIVTKYSIAPDQIDTVSGQYHSLTLKVTTDFANPPNAAMLTRNQHAVGAYFNAVQLAGSSPALAATVKQIVSRTTAEQLQSTYDTLSPAGYTLPVVTLFGNSVDFSNAMMSCKQASGHDNGNYHFVSEGQCGWFAISAGSQRHDATDTQFGFHRDSTSIAGGVQIAASDHWHIGFSASSGDERIIADRQSSSTAQTIDGSTTQLGIVTKANFDNNTIVLGITGGHGGYSATRNALLETQATGKQSMSFYTAQLRLSHTFDHVGWYWRPILDTRWMNLRRDAFSEQGAGGNNLDVAASTDAFAFVQPAIEFGKDVHSSSDLLRFYARAGVAKMISGSNVSVTASLQGAPTGVAPFTVYQSMDKAVVDLATGLDVITQQGMVLRFGYDGQLSSHGSRYGMNVKLSVPF
jgi:hypothetical protein